MDQVELEQCKAHFEDLFIFHHTGVGSPKDKANEEIDILYIFQTF